MEVVDELLSEHVERFYERLGPGGEVRCFFSPGRVNLMGAHLDYNGGPVMPMAIDRGTFIALRPRSDRLVRMVSTSAEGEFEFDLGTADDTQEGPTGAWYDYPLGVLLHQRRKTSRLEGMDLLFGGNLSIGAGLSSSASMCIGTAMALDRYWELGDERIDLVEGALWAEREFVGVHCGIMDPYAVGMSRADHLLWLDCRNRVTEHLPLDSRQVRIAVADSGVRRDLAESAFNQRVAECARAFELLRAGMPEAECLVDVPREHLEAMRSELSTAEFHRATHVLDEFERTRIAKRALEVGDLAGFGEQMSAAHRSLRDLFEVSISELDCLVDGANAWPGVLGARLTGAGFGGSVVILLRTDACEGFTDYLQRTFRERFGKETAVAFFAGDRGPRTVGDTWTQTATA